MVNIFFPLGQGVLCSARKPEALSSLALTSQVLGVYAPHLVVYNYWFTLTDLQKAEVRKVIYLANSAAELGSEIDCYFQNSDKLQNIPLL